MNGYYDDPDKLTFDRAEILVERYLREYGERRSRVTGKHVAKAYDLETSHHNLIRLDDALDDRLESITESGPKSTKYKIP